MGDVSLRVRVALLVHKITKSTLVKRSLLITSSWVSNDGHKSIHVRFPLLIVQQIRWMALTIWNDDAGLSHRQSEKLVDLVEVLYPIRLLACPFAPPFPVSV